MWRGLILCAGAIAVAMVACGETYGEDTPIADASPDAAPGLVTDAETGSLDSGGGSDSGTADADADASIDAGNNPCDAGFAPGPGSCTLVNPFQDPSFKTGAGWTATGGAAILTTTPGPDDLGVARVTTTTSPFGRVAQTVTLPSGLADLPISVTTVLRAQSPALFAGPPPLGIAVDGRPLHDWELTLRPAGDARTTVTVCLGEAAFGGPRQFTLRGLDSRYGLVEVDSIGVLFDLNCPPRAVVPNGDFESSGGWLLASKDQVGIVDGVGVGASRGLRFEMKYLTKASAERLVSVPSVSMTSPALQFHVSGAGNFHVKVDGALVARGKAAGDSVQRICMPEWSRGTVARLEIGTGGRGGDNHDDSEVGQAYTFDNLAFVDDDLCASAVTLENRGFESTDPTIPGWFVNAGKGYRVGLGAEAPHGGSGYLSLTSDAESCGLIIESPAVAKQTFRIPEYDRSVTGARLTYWYRHLPGNGALAEESFETLPTAAVWTKVTRCLSDVPGTRQQVSFSLSASVPPCSVANLDVDDVVIELDPTCKP